MGRGEKKLLGKRASLQEQRSRLSGEEKTHHFYPRDRVSRRLNQAGSLFLEEKKSPKCFFMLTMCLCFFFFAARPQAEEAAVRTSD